MYGKNIVYRGFCTLCSSRHPLGVLEHPLQIKGDNCTLICGLTVALLGSSLGRISEFWEPGWTWDLQTPQALSWPLLSQHTAICPVITTEMGFSVHDASELQN